MRFGRYFTASISLALSIRGITMALSSALRILCATVRAEGIVTLFDAAFVARVVLDAFIVGLRECDGRAV